MDLLHPIFYCRHPHNHKFITPLPDTSPIIQGVQNEAKTITMELKAGHTIIDVSKNNGLIDWGRVKNDPKAIKGAMLKVSEGATVMDKRFFENVRGCEANGLLWGGYHFATWNDENEVKDATHEAQFFLSIVRGAVHPPTLPLVLDTESNKPIPYTKEEMVTYVKTFTDIIKAEGYDVAIYGSPGFLNSYYPKDHPFTDIKLWVADYSGAINPVPRWKTFWMHQYTEAGKVQGISTNVDLNRIIIP